MQKNTEILTAGRFPAVILSVRQTSVCKNVSKYHPFHIIYRNIPFLYPNIYERIIYMAQQCNTSTDTGEYLAKFYSIISDMVTGMTGAELTNSISHNFIARMIPHHEAAIAMSKNILDYTQNNELRSIAENIIAEQTKSIENMKAVYEAADKLLNCGCDIRTYSCKTENIMRSMFSRMRNACTTDCIDANFIREMIPHHMGAICMSELALSYCILSELRPLLRDIISSQKKGIAQMQALLNRLCCR